MAEGARPQEQSVPCFTPSKKDSGPVSFVFIVNNIANPDVMAAIVSFEPEKQAKRLEETPMVT